ncbi:MAG: kelch repeat-containing protein, partial [Ferruginibacter sp.]
MKTFSKVFPWTLLLSILLIFISCKKEVTNTPPPAVNNPLTANAGADQPITYPTDSVVLIGSGTGKIISYKWSQMSGPNQATILDSALAKTTVKNLVLGVYRFQLIVRDASGDSAGDIMLVIITFPSTVQLIPVGQLSIKRGNVAVVAAGNKIFFAGGNLETSTSDTIPLYSRVDIYDVVTKVWSTAELSEARCDIGAVAVGNKILFAGGGNNWTGGYWGEVDGSTRIDIYDIITNKWSTNELPASVDFRLGLNGTAAAAGTKVIFCGGFFPTAYTYDVPNNYWTISSLSNPRINLASTSVGNKIFIGGEGIFGSEGTKDLDVFDVTTNLWTIDSLTDNRSLFRTGSLNNKAFFAGGEINGNFTNKVDIYDNATQTWSVSHLSRATTLAGTASSGSKMLFFESNNSIVDIYDT